MAEYALCEGRLSVTGRLDGDEEASLRENLAKLVLEADETLTLDLTAVESITSTCTGTIVTFWIDLCAAGKKLVESQCKKLGLECKSVKAKKDRLKQLKSLARKSKAKKLAWGLTLEDEAGLALRQLFEGKVKKGKERFLIAPLNSSPEKEIETYLKTRKVKFLKEKEKKDEYRQLMERFEKGQPGTKFQLMSSIEKLKQII